MSDKCPQNAAADKALAEEEAEEADSFCWDSREGSMSPSPKHSASSSLSSSSTRQQIQRISAKRSVPSKLRQSVFNGTSPLHVAALFASAAKAAVIGTGTDSALTRDENVSRLFMNSDEVFKIWEENIRQVEDVQNTRGVRKNASLHERGGNARYRDTQKLHNRRTWRHWWHSVPPLPSPRVAL